MENAKQECQLLTRRQASEFLGIKEATLATWAHFKRYNLPFVRIGGCIRYKKSDLEEFIEKGTSKDDPVAE